MIVSLGDVVSDQNAQTAAHQALVDQQAQATIDALKASGVTPIVEKHCSPATAAGYIETCTYAITVEGKPEYVGRMITGQEGDPQALARQIASDAASSHNYFGPTGPAASAPLPTAAAFKPTTASIVNLTRPGSSYFQVGDRWQVRVSGYENTHVCVTAKHPDGKSDTACYGSTDGSGLFTMTGTMDESTVGHWEEVWQVGSEDAPAFSFDVVKVQSTQQTQQQTSSGNQQTSGDSSGQKTTDKAQETTPSGFDLSTFVSENKWLLIGGAGVAVFMLMGKGK